MQTDQHRVLDPPGNSAVGHDVLHGHLRAVLDSEEFAGSERRRKLLEYLVEETLAGRGDDLKAYRIGRKVLGRPSGFDPQSDPIVRVEIGRLRATLDRYYRAHAASPVVISIPKGRYTAELTIVEDSPTESSASHRGGLTIERFTTTSARAAQIADAIVDSISCGVTSWTRDPGVVSVVDAGSADASSDECACWVRGTVRAIDDRVRVVIEGFIPGESAPFWTDSFDDAVADGNDFDLVDRLGERVTWMLVDDWGPLARRRRRLVDRMASQTARASQLAYYQAFDRVDRDLLGHAARELEPLASSPDLNARTLAALSDTTTAAWLLSSELASDVRQRAEDLAVRAVALDPRLVEAHLALGYAHFAAERSELMHQAFETALELTTPSPNTLHCAAFIYALDGSWERAEPMTARAVELNADLPVYWHLVPCVAALHRGEFDRAYIESLQIGDSIGFVGQALRLVTAFSQGLPTADEEKRFMTMVPDREVQAIEDTVARVFHDPVVRDLILRAVGVIAG